MAADAILIELLSESLNAKTADGRLAAKLLLDSLRAGLPAAEIAERIETAERKSSAGCAADARRLATRLGVLDEHRHRNP
jgi:hypothetical protein